MGNYTWGVYTWGTSKNISVQLLQVFKIKIKNRRLTLLLKIIKWISHTYNINTSASNYKEIIFSRRGNTKLSKICLTKQISLPKFFEMKNKSYYFFKLMVY